MTYSGCVSTHNYKGFATYWKLREGDVFSKADLFYDGCIAAYNERSGFYLGHAEGVTLSGCIARENGRHGVQLARRKTEKFADYFSISGGVVTGNGCSGIRLYGARYGTISGVAVLNNARLEDTSPDCGLAGIRIEDGVEAKDPNDPIPPDTYPSEGIVISGCLITDDRPAPTQTTAILARESTRKVFIFSNHVDLNPEVPDEPTIVLEACQDCETAHNVGYDPDSCDEGSCGE